MPERLVLLYEAHFDLKKQFFQLKEIFFVNFCQNASIRQKSLVNLYLAHFDEKKPLKVGGGFVNFCIYASKCQKD